MNLTNQNHPTETCAQGAIKTSLIAGADVQELVRARLGKSLTDAELAPYTAFARDIEELVSTRAARIKEQGGPSQAELAAMLRNPAIAYLGRLVEHGA